MRLCIDPLGTITCLYGEAIDLKAIGSLRIERASQVDPDLSGCWWADLAQIGGPKLGPFVARSVALLAEQVWLEQHRLGGLYGV